MNYNPNIHHRRSIRLKGYDYTQSGLYFITICTHQRDCLFGEIVEGVVSLNSIGLCVQACWKRLSHHFPNLDLDVFVIMPNHLHGILILKDDMDREKGKEFDQNSLTKSETSQPIINNQGEAFRQDSLTKSESSQPILNNQGEASRQDSLTKSERSLRNASPLREIKGTQSGSIGAIIQNFKSVSTRQINRIRQTKNAPIWQRNYYEHIVRNEESLAQIRNYIQNNPLSWDNDQLHPNNLY